MQLLPRDFLSELAKQYELSPEQTEAFVERLGSDASEDVVAETLHISPNAFRTRMSGVYRRFSIRGNAPGKLHRLRNWLIGEYQKSRPAATVNSSQLNIGSSIHDIQEQTTPLLLLMKQTIDAVVEEDEKLQKFLKWVSEKSESVYKDIPYKPCAIRAFYFELVFSRFTAFDTDQIDPDLKLVHALDRNLSTIEDATALDLDLCLTLTLNIERTYNLDPDRNINSIVEIISARIHDFAIALQCTNPHSHLRYELERLNSQLPNALQEYQFDLMGALEILEKHKPVLTLNDRKKREEKLLERQNLEEIRHWWIKYSRGWIEQFRSVILRYRDLGYQWQFEKLQKQHLQRYYNNYQLLVDCLNNTNCDVNHSVRQEIEETLLLPMAEIEKRIQDQR